MKALQIEKEIKTILSPKRYKHSLNVRDISVPIAKKYNLDIKLIEKAALLHDIAKDYDLLESMKLADKYGLDISKEEKNNPALIHSKLGVKIAQNELGISNTEILTSIENHTTGKPNMSIFQLVIYVSDYLDPDRKLINQEIVANTVKKNIFEAALLVCISKLEYVLESIKHINVKSINFYNWLLTKQ